MENSIRRSQNRQRLEASANQLLKGKKVRRGKRKKNKIKIPLMRYNVYIKSKYWKRRRSQYFSKFGRACSVCGYKNGVHLHHKVYDPKLYGKEPDEHLTALCGRHHNEFHAHHVVSKDMQDEPDTYIKTMKQLGNSNIDDLSWI